MGLKRSKAARKWRSAAAQRLLTLANNVTTVEEAVSHIVADLHGGAYSPPTDLRVISEKLNVLQWRPNEALPLHGRLLPEGNGFVVEYSATQTPERQRFTIAHELGHAVFAKTGPAFPKHGEELERICDLIATELLMPRLAFSAKVGGTWSTATVVALAREFGTSLAATALRCLEFNRAASIFLVNGSTVSWGYGEVRRGPTGQLPEQIARVVVSGAGGRGNVSVREPDGRVRQWYLESTRLGTQGLFALHPLGRGGLEPEPHRASRYDAAPGVDPSELTHA